MTNSRTRRGRPRAFTERPEQTRVQSLDRALDILDLLARRDGLTLTQIAEALGQSPATLYRALVTFAHRGMVESDPVAQTWHVGPAAFRYGAAFLRRSSLVERARPVMRALMEETGETANLGVAQNWQVLFLDQVETHETIRAFFPPGTRSPLHASGIGKALLSAFSPAQLSRFFAEAKLEAFTARTLTHPARLRAEIAQSAARGWALDDGEKSQGMRCIAAPVRGAHGEAVAGISVSGPTHRLTDARLEATGRAVVRAADTLSRALGGTGAGGGEGEG